MEKNLKNYCLKWGTKYGPDYVNNLQDQLQQDVICITDDPTGLNCDSIELPKTSVKWWNKMVLFNEDFIKGPGVFYDLDMAIRKNHDWFQPDEYMKFLYTDWLGLKQLKQDTVDKKHKYCSINSSIICWDERTKRNHIWEYYQKHKEKIEFSFSGIDTFIEHRFPNDYNLYDTGLVSSYYKNGSSGDIILFDGER
jgi:hypothetical protein